jgi:hypothetical protein
MLGLTLVVLVGAVLVQSVRTDAQEFARFHSAIGRSTRGQAAVVLDTNAAIPDGLKLGFNFVHLKAGRLRQLLKTYGVQTGGTDQRLVATGAVRLLSGPRAAAPARCRGLAQPMRARVEAQLKLYAPAREADIVIRRFGTEWITVGSLPKGREGTLVLPGFHATEEWELRATGGACAAQLRP